MTQEPISPAQRGFWSRFLSRGFWIVLFGAVFLFVGYRLAFPNAARPAGPSSADIRAEKGIPVMTYTVEEGRWDLWKTFYGQVQSATTQQVTSFVREYITGVSVQVGDRVKAGDILVELSRELEGTHLSALTADYQDALKEYERKKSLHSAGGVSKQEVEKAYVALQQKKSLLTDVHTRLSRTVVRSKLTGVVVARDAEIGEIADAGRQLLKVADLSNLEVDVALAPADILRVRPGVSARIHLQGLTFPGSVKRLDPQATASTGMHRCIVSLQPGVNLLPGTFVEVELQVDSRDGVISIPYEVLRREGESTLVFVVSGDRAVRRVVTLGDGQGGIVEVRSKLFPGDILVKEGLDSVYDGAKIWVRGGPDDPGGELPGSGAPGRPAGAGTTSADLPKTN